MQMKKRLLGLLVVLASVALAGCQTSGIPSPRGHYSSTDDMGLFVFQPDGVFGYKFAAKFDFYHQGNLPPHRGHWRLKPDGTLEIELDESDAPKFQIEWYPKRDAFDVIRLERTDGTFPMKAHYNHTSGGILGE